MSLRLTSITIVLSWPEPCLWPNRRAHELAKARARRYARDEAYVVTRDALSGQVYQHDGQPIKLSVYGRPGRNSGQDADNLQAALKESFDGIAQALGVNDRHFRPVTVIGEPSPPRGFVTVIVGSGA